MKKIFKNTVIICVVILLAVSASFITGAEGDVPLTSCKDFMWGVNTHHDYYNVYASANVEDQMHLMAELGVKLIRTGFSSNLDWTDKVVRMANKYGMKVMLCNGSVRSTLEEYDADLVFATAKMIANRYNGKKGYGKVDYIQIDNEVDNYLMSRAHEAGLNPGDGSDKNKYIKEDVERVCYMFNNYAAGIRAADSDIKIIINSGWTHYGFHDWLEEYKVDYDIIGFDWYTDMSTTFINRGKRPVEQVEFLHDRYGKDIIICETNQWVNEETDESNAASYDDFITLLNDAYTYPYVLGACVYELCDEAYMEKVDGPYYREAHFGLINADRHGNMYDPKPIYYRLQKLWGGGKVNKIKYSDILKEYERDNSSEDDPSDDSGSSNSGTSSEITSSDSSRNNDNNGNGNGGFVLPSSDDSNSSGDSSIIDSSDNTVSDSNTNTSSEPSVIKKPVTKFVWTTENTLTVIVAGVCVLLLAGCMVFIIHRNKQIKLMVG